MEFPALREKFKEPVRWSRTYFVASVVGAPLAVDHCPYLLLVPGTVLRLHDLTELSLSINVIGWSGHA